MGLTRNVRNVRKSLGDIVLDCDKSLKSELLKLELLFEHRQQDELEAIAVAGKTARVPSAELCQSNFGFYLASEEIMPAKCAELTEELCKSIFSSN